MLSKEKQRLLSSYRDFNGLLRVIFVRGAGARIPTAAAASVTVPKAAVPTAAAVLCLLNVAVKIVVQVVRGDIAAAARRRLLGSRGGPTTAAARCSVAVARRSAVAA
jgi:hypothetical protein